MALKSTWESSGEVLDQPRKNPETSIFRPNRATNGAALTSIRIFPAFPPFDSDSEMYERILETRINASHRKGINSHKDFVRKMAPEKGRMMEPQNWDFVPPLFFETHSGGEGFAPCRRKTPNTPQATRGGPRGEDP